MCKGRGVGVNKGENSAFLAARSSETAFPALRERSARLSYLHLQQPLALRVQLHVTLPLNLRLHLRLRVLKLIKVRHKRLLINRQITLELMLLLQRIVLLQVIRPLVHQQPRRVPVLHCSTVCRKYSRQRFTHRHPLLHVLHDLVVLLDRIVLGGNVQG